MGYYADLIKQKQEKRNSYGKRIETVGYCDIYEDSNGYFVLVKDGRIIKKGYHTKEEAERDARRVRSKSELVKIAKDFYFYDKWTKQHIADSLKRTELGITDEEIRKILDEAGIRNSKEEKENESTVEKFDHYGSKIEIIKTDSGNFRYRISKKGNFKESMSVSTRSEAMRDAIKQAETWANEKEEKDNQKFSSIEQAFAYIEKQGYEIERRDWHKRNPLQWEWLPVKKDGRSSQIEFFKDLDEYGHFTGKVDAYVNAKEEKDNGRIEEMYREIQELKKKGLSSMDIDKYYAAINYRKTAEQYLAEYKKTKNTDYKYAAEGQLRKAEQLEKEYKKHLHNADEKGYYAKLAEEKASRKH